jgi:hypothetical protein
MRKRAVRFAKQNQISSEAPHAVAENKVGWIPALMNK